MQHVADYLKIEDLENIENFNILDFYVFINFEGIIVEGIPAYPTSKVEEFLGRPLTIDEKESMYDEK